MTDIVERLKDISDSDHNRGCQGREYSCSCGYDEENRKTAAEASQEITRLREEVRVLSYQYKCACETVEDQHYALNKRRAPTSEPL